METLKQYSILYAEDESIIRMNITQQLEQYFKCVHVAKNGAEALTLYNEKKPDVLMLDIEMPQLTGLEVARKVRETNRDIPIMMLTAYTESTLLLDAVELGLTKYLVKPLSKVKLKEALLKIAEQLTLLSQNSIILSDTYYWDKEGKKLYKEKYPLSFTSREQILLELLMSKYQKNVSFTDIMAYVWEDKYDEEISIDSVKKLVSTLRQKLPENALKSVYGEGYVLI
jgi:DNA-binding response OmpR family regulator